MNLRLGFALLDWITRIHDAALVLAGKSYATRWDQ